MPVVAENKYRLVPLFMVNIPGVNNLDTQVEVQYTAGSNC